MSKIAGSFVAALAIVSLSGCGENVASESAKTTESTTSTAPPSETTTLSLTVETTKPVFLIAETDEPGAACGGNAGGVRVAESSEVVISADQTTLVEATAEDGTLLEIVIRDDLSIESITCQFSLAIELSAIDADVFDVLFTSGRTVSVGRQMVTLEELRDGLLITTR